MKISKNIHRKRNGMEKRYFESSDNLQIPYCILSQIEVRNLKII